METILGNIFNMAFALVGLIIVTGVCLKLFANRFSKEKSVLATVTDKQCYDREIVSKSQPIKVQREYVVTFISNEKELHFNVSELSYKGFYLNQKGVLKYNGNRIISFQ